MLAEAATLAPDEVILDLEDAVAPAEKQAARAKVAEALAHAWSAPTVAVRVNAVCTPWWHDDLAVAARAGCVVLPKVESPEQLEAVTALLPPGTSLEAQIETARGLVEVERIAAARAPLEALVFGPGDLAASLGMPQLAIGSDGGQWHYALARIVTAARAFGLQAIDGPYGRLDDADGLRESARAAWLLGYDGKWAIHPDQIAICTDVFTPAPEEVERAERLLAVAGAARVEGELVDEATRRMAESVLRRRRLDGAGKERRRRLRRRRSGTARGTVSDYAPRLMDERDPVPPDEEIVPDDAGDAYVAHATPDIGTARNRRLLLFGVLPIVAIAVVIAIVIVLAR